MSDSTQVSESSIARVGRAISGSAEYVVALGLLLVCAVVGLAVWFSGSADSPDEDSVIRIVAPAQTAQDVEVSEEQLAEEQAALEALQDQLRQSLQDVEAAGRQEFEAAERERQEELERQAAAERRAAELAEQQRLAEEKVARLQAELEARRKRLAAEFSRQTPVAEPVRTSATVDWDSCRKPVYPRSSRMNGEEGLVTLALDIDADGRVQDGRIQQSSGSRELDRTTLRALRQCRFNPATVDGKPTAVTGLVEFNWSLR